MHRENFTAKKKTIFWGNW